MDYAGIELISVIFLSIRALLCPTESPLLAIQTFVSPHTAPPDRGVLVHNRLSDYSSIRFLKLVIVSADIPQPVVAKL